MDAEEIAKALGAMFPVRQVKWKPQKTNKAKTRALAVAYIDARDVMQRLDAAVGSFNWSDRFRVLQVGGETVIECTLTLSIGDVTVSKTDVGEASGSDYISAAKTGFSDAFKRAAVKFGIGRYLYYLPVQWVGYDSQRKKLTEAPRLPTWAIPLEEQKKAPEPPPKTEKVTESEPSNEPHWSTLQSKKGPVVDRFWAWTDALGLSHRQVHIALDVRMVREFKGSMEEAKIKIEAWIKAQAEAEDAQREQANRDLTQEEAEELPY